MFDLLPSRAVKVLLQTTLTSEITNLAKLLVHFLAGPVFAGKEAQTKSKIEDGKHAVIFGYILKID